MSEVKTPNLPTMSVDEVVNRLSAMYCAALKAGRPLKKFPSVMLWGPPGVGKSQAVREIGEKIRSETGKRVAITEVRLLLFNPIDLRGIPTASADKRLAVWLRPKIFDMDAGDGVCNVLFLDEISSAPPSVQAAAYQITLDRTVGEHRLPENCIVVAAGNRVTDRSVAYRMPKALSNRLLHIEVAASFLSWRRWAVENGIHEKVVGFLSFRQNYLSCFDPSNDDLAFATPRSWELVSNLLCELGGSIDALYPLIAGIVGTGVATEFRTWERVYRGLPSIEDIFAGRPAPVPKEPDALYALTASMTAYAREHKNDLTRIANSIRYADRLPPDFAVILMKDYLFLEKGYREKLMRLPEFVRWLSSKGSLLNGTAGY